MIREKTHILVLLLWFLNSIMRIVFGIMTITLGSLLDVEVSLIVEQIITVMFLALGILGFIAIPGLLNMRNWGVQLAIVASVATIIFDIWGMTIQFTAALGFVVPVVMLLYIYLYRKKTRVGETE